MRRRCKALVDTPPVEDDTRQRILDSAGPIFAQRGFTQATVREICAAAGVNVASVGYYFGDKMGLYLAVIRLIRGRREQAFPMPELSGEPPERLFLQINTLLQRIMTGDDSGWEAALMMREMQHPTEAFREMVEEYFRPLFERLQATIRCLLGEATEARSPEIHEVEQIALSIVGQCLYYRVGGEVVQQLIPRDRRQAHYDTPSLARHITALTLASLTGGTYFEQLNRFTESSTHE